MNNTHAIKYLTAGGLMLVLALGGLAGCASDEATVTSTTETVETTTHPAVGPTTTTETRVYER